MTPNNSIKSYLELIEAQDNLCGRFTNIKRLDDNGGPGNFSLIFTALDSSLKRNKEVILKFYNPQRIGEKYRLDSFYREAEILKKLKGKRNILPIVHDLTSISFPLTSNYGNFSLNLVFFASHKAKYSLEDYIYTYTNEYGRNINFFREVCKSLQRIHKIKICHRDLKPGNFLVFPEGYVCLSDFGSAHDYELGNQLLKNYELIEIGDPGYRSLELKCGLPITEDTFFIADFFSLGAILFELFTRNVLSDYLFRDHQIEYTVNIIQSLQPNERRNAFEQIIDQLEANHPLPSIRKIEPEIPKSIANEVDKLYKSLATLDFRKREMNFDNIFRKINICEKCIQYYLKKEQKKRKY